MLQMLTTAATLPLLLGLAYVGRLAWAPFVACRKCSGDGKRKRAFGRTVQCSRCAGLGERLRLGVRLWCYSTGRSR